MGLLTGISPLMIENPVRSPIDPPMADNKSTFETVAALLIRRVTPHITKKILEYRLRLSLDSQSSVEYLYSTDD